MTRLIFRVTAIEAARPRVDAQYVRNPAFSRTSRCGYVKTGSLFETRSISGEGLVISDTNIPRCNFIGVCHIAPPRDLPDDPIDVPTKTRRVPREPVASGRGPGSEIYIPSPVNGFTCFGFAEVGSGLDTDTSSRWAGAEPFEPPFVL